MRPSEYHRPGVGTSASGRLRLRHRTGMVEDGGMDVTADGELIELEGTGARVFVVAGGRRVPGADAVLRGTDARPSRTR